MPHYSLLHEKDYLGHQDLLDEDGKNIEITVTIEKIEPLKELTMQGGRKSNKTVLSFKGAKKKLILSAHKQSDVIAKIHGENWKDWIGKKITLLVGSDMNPKTKSIGPCIRIKDPSGKAPKPKNDKDFDLK